MTIFKKEELLNLKIVLTEYMTFIRLSRSDNIANSELTALNHKINEGINYFDSKKDITGIYSIKRKNDMMIIIDNTKNEIYCIYDHLVYQGDVAPYHVENRKNAILKIKTWINEDSETMNETLMIEDLQILENTQDDYILSNYERNGFYTKNNPIEFNKICTEIIETYKEYVDKKKMENLISRIMR